MAKELSMEQRREISRFNTVEFTQEEIRAALGGVTLNDTHAASPVEIQPDSEAMH